MSMSSTECVSFVVVHHDSVPTVSRVCPTEYNAVRKNRCICVMHHVEERMWLTANYYLLPVPPDVDTQSPMSLIRLLSAKGMQ